jgi:myo-inositol-1(or 4)-monophosphatase
VTAAGVAARALVAELTEALREQVLPALGAHAAREHAGEAAGGDVTFAIDEAAEAFLEEFLAERAPGLAFYSEDRGLVEPARGGEAVLVVDPIDGTRPALAGLESACVAVALAPMRGGEPTMGDVEMGCVVEIKSGARFLAVRGEGVEVTGAQVALTDTTDLERLFWIFGFRGRPAAPMVEVLGELIDRSSVGGASFDLGSASFAITRVLTGQVDAYVEPGPRLVEEVRGMRALFEAVGGGAILNNSPYDLAAAVLCLTEAGGVVTDAHGRSLDDRPLLGSQPEHQMSVIASSNRALHDSLVETVETAIARLQRA